MMKGSPGERLRADVRTGCCEADLEDDTEKELALPCVNSNVRKGPVTEQNLRSGVKGVSLYRNP